MRLTETQLRRIIREAILYNLNDYRKKKEKEDREDALSRFPPGTPEHQAVYDYLQAAAAGGYSINIVPIPKEGEMFKGFSARDFTKPQIDLIKRAIEGMSFEGIEVSSVDEGGPRMTWDRGEGPGGVPSIGIRGVRFESPLDAVDAANNIIDTLKKDPAGRFIAQRMKPGRTKVIKPSKPKTDKTK